MPNDHPFQLLFESLGRVPQAHADLVNRRALEALAGILTVPVDQPGRCILLRAPRAGHGKTHLLSCIQHQLGGTSEFIPLYAASGSRIDAATVTDDTLRRLVRQLPASGGLTVLDLVTRRLFASALQPLVGSGEVPCQDREGALTALRTRPIETFDFHHPTAVTAHWALENFEVLGQRLSQELAQRADLPVSDVAFWVEEMFRYASAPLDNFSRVSTLAEKVHASPGTEMERLQALLGMLTLLTRVVLVADDLEGFSADESAALRLAAFLGALRQTVEHVDVILSLNEDVWQSAFLPRLSDGLADRLSEVVVELQPLTEPEMVALLESRVPGLGTRVLERVDLREAGTHARGLIRAAGVAWIKAASSQEETPATATPAEPDREETFREISPEPPAAPEEIPAAPAEMPEPPTSPEPLPFFTDSQEVSAPRAEEPAFAWPAAEFAVPSDVTLSSGKSADAEPVTDYFMAPPSLSSEPSADPFAGGSWPDAFPASTPFALDPWQLPIEPARDPAPFALPEESPFQPAPAAPAAEPFASAGWREPSPFSFAPAPSGREDSLEVPVPSPFQAFADEEPAPSVFAAEPAFADQQGPETIVSPSAPPSEVSPPQAPADSDRVDDLLRQFRERYGRGSL